MDAQNAAVKAEEKAEKLMADQEQVLAILLDLMLAEIRNQCHVFRTPYELWEVLKTKYRKDWVDKKYLFSQLFYLTFPEGGTVASDMKMIENMVDQLTEAGETASDAIKGTTLLKGLPRKFDMIRTVICEDVNKSYADASPTKRPRPTRTNHQSGVACQSP